jgi:hypothetical protein
MKENEPCYGLTPAVLSVIRPPVAEASKAQFFGPLKTDHEFHENRLSVS